MYVLGLTGSKICLCPTHTLALSGRAYPHGYSRSFFFLAGSPMQGERLMDPKRGCKGASFTPALHGAFKPVQSGVCMHGRLISDNLRPKWGFLRPAMAAFGTSLRPGRCNVQLRKVSWSRVSKTVRTSSDTDMKPSLSILARTIRNAAQKIAEAYLSRAVLQQGVTFRMSHRRSVHSRYPRSPWGHSKNRRWQSQRRG
jgi:hypothetical protein